MITVHIQRDTLKDGTQTFAVVVMDSEGGELTVPCRNEGAAQALRTAMLDSLKIHAADGVAPGHELRSDTGWPVR